MRAQKTGVCVPRTEFHCGGRHAGGGNGEVRKGESSEDFVGGAFGLWILLKE